MADNVIIPASGTGTATPNIATDDVGGVQHQRVKVEWGADGVATDTSAANPLPVVQTGTPALPTGAATDATNAANGVLVGAVTETAPGTDTASSGLNGRLQRIAQRLTSLIALLPGSLGQKTSAASLAVVVASDQSAVPVSGTVTANAGTGTLAVSLASVPSHAVTNAGTFATQDSQKVVDNAAFTDGTTPVQPAGYVFDEVAGTALTENDAAAARIDSKRAQVGVIEDATTRGQRAAVSAAGAVKVDGSAVTQPVSGTVTTTPPANASSNVAQINGVTPLMGAGNTGTGSPRVTIATDQAVLPVNNANPVQAATATLANVAGSASSVTLQASNAARKGLVIVNDSTAILYVKFGSAASTTSFTYFLAGSVGGVPATLELPAVVYTGIVTGIWASAVGNARVTELT